MHDLFDIPTYTPAQLITLRKYQTEAVDALYHYWNVGDEDGENAGHVGNALIDMGTGLGKSLIIAEIVRTLITDFPGARVLMAVHVRELIQQNYDQLLALWPQARSIVGIYSAGMGLRQSETPIVFGGIQSISHQEQIDGFDLVLVDEAHRIPKDGFGRYLTLLERLRKSRPHLKVVGLTATPYRLDSGRLDEGEKRIFDKIVYSYNLGPGIADGWLAPLRSRSGVAAAQISVAGVKKTGGEFNAGQLEHAALKAGIVEAACADIQRKAKGGAIIPGSDKMEPVRKSWLIFATGIDHADAITRELERLGVLVSLVIGETPKAERDRTIGQFRRGEITALVNVGVLTEGFDAPGVDMICMLRPTLSTGLYVQMVGRGVRKADGKTDCLVLDYSGNIKRHGPVDDVKPNVAGTTQVRECPKCQTLNKKSALECVGCGFLFPLPQQAEEPRERVVKHDAKAEKEISILSGRPAGYELPVEHQVFAWAFSPWISRNPGAPRTMRVAYAVARNQVFYEWVCLEHPRDSYPRRKAEEWWVNHWTINGQVTGAGIRDIIGNIPVTVEDAIRDIKAKHIGMPSHVTVRKEGQYYKVVACRYGPYTHINPRSAG